MAAFVTNSFGASSTKMETVTDLHEQQQLEVIEAVLREEEEQDMIKTMQLLELTADYEEKLKEEEEEDMGKTLEILSNALTASELRVLNSSNNKIAKFVQFSPHVAIILLPESERLEARDARRNKWGSGPVHDELWDGDTNSFRDVELTPEELSILLRRRTLVSKIRNFLFTRVVNIDARAHARKMKDEDEEESEDISLTKEKRKSSIRLKSFLRRRSTKTPTTSNSEPHQQLSEEWVKQMLKQSAELDEVASLDE